MGQGIVSLKKKMTDNLQQADQLLAESLPEGIIFLDISGHILWCNQNAVRLLGLEDESYLKKHIDRALHKKIFATLKKDELIESALPNRPNNYISIHLRDFNQQLVLIVRDVTVTHKLETMRKDFVANVSHELRTPLTVFQGYLELLKDGADISREQLSEIVLHMDSQATRMHQLVEDLLLLSRLESVEPDVERHQEIPLASMLRNIRDDAISLSGKNKHHFILEVDESLILNGDPEEIRSALSNLVYNAVHYTPAGGNITIRCFENDTVQLVEIEDTGIGIESKYIPRITQRFYRVDKARSSAAGGTGLGLALVKHVLLRHHGDLEIESELGKGSIFRCIFPINN
jgi:two-component system phosphate regulon sensor histidine kinase PhoR